MVLALCLFACSHPKPPLETVHDLVALFPVAEVRSEIDGVDFGTREARAALVSGWSRNETRADGVSFVWSLGDASTVEFFLASARDLQVAIRCAPFILPQSMQVEINDRSIGRVVMAPGMREYVIAVPRAAVTPGRNRLVFRYANVSASNAETGHRRVAVQWDALRFRAVRQPDPPRLEQDAVYLPFGTGLVYFLNVPDAGELALPSLEARGGGGGHLDVAVLDEAGTAAVHTVEPGTGLQSVDLPDRSLVRLALRAVPPAPGVEGGLWVKAPAVRGARGERSRTETATRPRPWTGKPNVIIYLVDALRAGRLGCYGAARPTSPSVDAFAKAATLYERAVAQATWTRPAVTSLLTGLGPHAHGVQTLDDRLPDAAVTLPELLHGGGYRTAGFSTNLHVSAATGLAQGFDDFELMADAPSSDVVNQRVLAWLDAHRSDRGTSPFFLYIHTLDPHAPYEPSVEMLQKFAPGVRPGAGTHEEILRTFAMPPGEERTRRVAQLSALYDAEVSSNDRSFGDLVAELKRRGLYDESLIIFVADHGEELDDHGFLGHANNLYAETLDVPLIIKWPRQTVGERVSNLAQQIDLLPTILRASGLRLPDGLPGSDLFTLSGDADREAFSHLRYDGRDGMSVVAGGWKLILPFSRKLAAGPELYQRAKDPDDQNDLAVRNEVRTGWLQSQIRLELLRTRLPETAPAPVDPETRKALEALGYQ